MAFIFGFTYPEPIDVIGLKNTQPVTLNSLGFVSDTNELIKNFLDKR